MEKSPCKSIRRNLSGKRDSFILTENSPMNGKKMDKKGVHGNSSLSNFRDSDLFNSKMNVDKNSRSLRKSIDSSNIDNLFSKVTAREKLRRGTTVIANVEIINGDIQSKNGLGHSVFSGSSDGDYEICPIIIKAEDRVRNKKAIDNDTRMKSRRQSVESKTQRNVEGKCENGMSTIESIDVKCKIRRQRSCLNHSVAIDNKIHERSMDYLENTNNETKEPSTIEFIARRKNDSYLADILAEKSADRSVKVGRKSSKTDLDNLRMVVMSSKTPSRKSRNTSEIGLTVRKKESNILKPLTLEYENQSTKIGRQSLRNAIKAIETTIEGIQTSNEEITLTPEINLNIDGKGETNLGEMSSEVSEKIVGKRRGQSSKNKKVTQNVIVVSENDVMPTTEVDLNTVMKEGEFLTKRLTEESAVASMKTIRKSARNNRDNTDKNLEDFKIAELEFPISSDTNLIGCEQNVINSTESFSQKLEIETGKIRRKSLRNSKEMTHVITEAFKVIDKETESISEDKNETKLSEVSLEETRNMPSESALNSLTNNDINANLVQIQENVSSLTNEIGQIFEEGIKTRRQKSMLNLGINNDKLLSTNINKKERKVSGATRNLTNEEIPVGIENEGKYRTRQSLKNELRNTDTLLTVMEGNTKVQFTKGTRLTRSNDDKISISEEKSTMMINNETRYKTRRNNSLLVDRQFSGGIMPHKRGRNNLTNIEKNTNDSFPEENDSKSDEHNTVSTSKLRRHHSMFKEPTNSVTNSSKYGHNKAEDRKEPSQCTRNIEVVPVLYLEEENKNANEMTMLEIEEDNQSSPKFEEMKEYSREICMVSKEMGSDVLGTDQTLISIVETEVSTYNVSEENSIIDSLRTEKSAAIDEIRTEVIEYNHRKGNSSESNSGIEETAEIDTKGNKVNMDEEYTSNILDGNIISFDISTTRIGDITFDLDSTSHADHDINEDTTVRDNGIQLSNISSKNVKNRVITILSNNDEIERKVLKNGDLKHGNFGILDCGSEFEEHEDDSVGQIGNVLSTKDDSLQRNRANEDDGIDMLNLNISPANVDSRNEQCVDGSPSQKRDYITHMSSLTTIITSTQPLAVDIMPESFSTIQPLSNRPVFRKGTKSLNDLSIIKSHSVNRCSMNIHETVIEPMCLVDVSCSYLAKNVSDLRKHIQQFHYYECALKGNDSVRTDETDRATKQSNSFFKCRQCSQSFDSLSQLQTHKLLHSLDFVTPGNATEETLSSEETTESDDISFIAPKRKRSKPHSNDRRNSNEPGPKKFKHVNGCVDLHKSRFNRRRNNDGEDIDAEEASGTASNSTITEGSDGKYVCLRCPDKPTFPDRETYLVHIMSQCIQVLEIQEKLIKQYYPSQYGCGTCGLMFKTVTRMISHKEAVHKKATHPNHHHTVL